MGSFSENGIGSTMHGISFSPWHGGVEFIRCLFEVWPWCLERVPGDAALNGGVG